MAAVVDGGLGSTGGLDAMVVVVVVVVLVVGHMNMDVTALLGMKYCMSSFMDLLFFWDLLGFGLLLCVGTALLQKLVWS